MNQKRSIIKLAKPLRVADVNGNDVTVKSLSCDIQIGGGVANVCPDMYQLRDALTQKPGNGDTFIIPLDADAELSAAMEGVYDRVVTLVRSRLEAANE